MNILNNFTILMDKKLIIFNLIIFNITQDLVKYIKYIYKKNSKNREKY
jgi:hypothetical protein